MCWPCLPSQSLFPGLLPGPAGSLLHSFYLDCSLTDLLIPSPLFKTHMPHPTRSPSWSILQMGHASSPIQCASSWHLHWILHCNNLSACLSSHLHPSLEKVKGSDLIDHFHLYIQNTRSRNWCATNVPLQPVQTCYKASVILERLCQTAQETHGHFISGPPFSHMKNEHNKTYLKGTSWWSI